MPRVQFDVDVGSSLTNLSNLAKGLREVEKAAKDLGKIGVSVEQISKAQEGIGKSSVSAKKAEAVYRSLAKSLGGVFKTTVQYQEAIEKLNIVRESGVATAQTVIALEREIEKLHERAPKETYAQVLALKRLNEERQKGAAAVRAEENTRVRRGGGPERDQVALERHSRELDVALAGGTITVKEATKRYYEYEQQLAQTALTTKKLKEEEEKESKLRRAEKHDLELGGQARTTALIARKTRELNKDVKEGIITQEKMNKVLAEYSRQAKLAATVTTKVKGELQNLVGATAVIAFGPLSGVGSRFIALNNIIRLVSDNFSTLAVSLGVVGAAVAGVAAGIAIFNKFEQIANEIDKMQKAATRLGISLSEFQALDFAAQRSGLAGVERLMTRLGSIIGDAARDTGEAKTAFEDLSISWKDLREQDPSEQIKTISDAFVALKDSQKGVSIAKQLFGARESRAINLFLTKGGGIQELIDRARELGLVLDNAAGPRAEEFVDRLLELRLQFKNLTFTIASEFMPTLTWMMSVLIDKFPTALGALLIQLDDWGLVSIRTMGSTQVEINRIQEALDKGFTKYYGPTGAIFNALKNSEEIQKRMELGETFAVFSSNVPFDAAVQGYGQVKVALLELHNVAKSVNSAAELENIRETLLRMRETVVTGLPEIIDPNSVEAGITFTQGQARDFIQTLLDYLKELEAFWIRTGAIAGLGLSETSKAAQKAANDFKQLFNVIESNEEIVNIFNQMNVHLSEIQVRTREAWQEADKYIETLTKFNDPIQNFNVLSEMFEDIDPAIFDRFPDFNAATIESFRPTKTVGVYSKEYIDKLWRDAFASAKRYATEFYQHVKFEDKQLADQRAQTSGLSNRIRDLEHELLVIRAQGADRAILIKRMEEEERARNNAVGSINRETLARIQQEDVLSRELVRQGRWQEAAQQFEDIFANAFENIVNGGIESFGDLWDTILQDARNMLAQLLRELIFSPENFGFSTGAGAGSVLSGGFSSLFGSFGQSDSTRNLLYKQQQETLYAIEANTRGTHVAAKSFDLNLGIAGEDLSAYFKRSGKEISKAVEAGFADTSNLSQFQQFIQSDYVSIGGSILGSILSGFAIGSSIAGLAAGPLDESVLGTKVGAAVGSVVGTVLGALFGGGIIGGGTAGAAGATGAQAGATGAQAGSSIAGAQLGGALGGGLLGTVLGWVGGAFGELIGRGSWPWEQSNNSSFSSLWKQYSVLWGGDIVGGAILAGIEAYERNRAETSAAGIITAPDLESLDPFFQRGITPQESPFGTIGIRTRRFSDYAEDAGVFAQDIVDQMAKMDEAIALALTPAEIQAVSDALLGAGVFQEITRDPRNDVGALFIDRINTIMNTLGADPAAYGLTLEQTGGFFFDAQAEALSRFIQERRKGQLAIDELSGNIFSEGEQALIALQDQWIALTTTLEKAGFNVEAITAAYESGIHAVEVALDFDVERQIVAIEDPFISTMEAIRGATEGLLRSAVDLGVSTERILHLNQIKVEAAVERYLSPIVTVIEGIELDNLAPIETLETLQAKFNELIAEGNDPGAIANSAQRLLQQTQLTYGRTGKYFEEAARVQEELEAFDAEIRSQGERQIALVEQQLVAIESGNADNVELMEQMIVILRAISAGNNLPASELSTANLTTLQSAEAAYNAAIRGSDPLAMSQATLGLISASESAFGPESSLFIERMVFIEQGLSNFTERISEQGLAQYDVSQRQLLAIEAGNEISASLLQLILEAVNGLRDDNAELLDLFDITSSKKKAS